MQKALRILSQWRHQGIMALVRTIMQRIGWNLRRVVRKVLSPPGLFGDKYIVIDNTEVTLYTDNGSLFLNYAPRKSPSCSLKAQRVEVSLIASVMNEADNAAGWVKSVLNQTRLPDEIIVVDADSTDGTVEILESLAKQSAVPFKVMVEPGANIACARNKAIARARFAVIAVTDFGCRLKSDWLDKILAPFELQPDTQVSAGVFVALNRRGQPIRQHRQWRIEQIKPQHYLPSSRSIAFKKDAWSAVGGYPEWLTLTGEDTYFDLELKRYGGEWAFVPEAVVEWAAPDTFVSYLQKEYRWSVGDGESGVAGRTYWYFVWALGLSALTVIIILLLSALVLLSSLQPTGLWIGLVVFAGFISLLADMRAIGLDVFALPELMASVAMVAGFLQGARRQNEITRRRLSLAKGTFFVLSGVPIDDTGGGARCTQIALELLRQGFAVVFISKFPKYESRELDLKIFHPNLFTFALSKFKWEQFLETYGQPVGQKHLVALVEFPLADFLPLISRIIERGGVVVYDLLDDWNTSLGKQWYSMSVETEIIKKSQVLVATTAKLADRLEQMSGRAVTCLPNAVNARLFDPQRNYSRPDDLPWAEWVAIYIGALWGEWFDWSLLIQIAKQYSEAAIVIIGDYHGQCPEALPNLHFLGLKPQRELPAYLAYADVAIVPWKINEITQATSPLKVYEYFAMRCPVVAPDLDPLQGMPSVFFAKGAREFVAQMSKARQAPFPVVEINRFVNRHNWQARIAILLAAIEQVHHDGRLVGKPESHSIDTMSVKAIENTSG